MPLVRTKYLPTNLYYLFIKAPDFIWEKADSLSVRYPFIKTDMQGLSIFITTPLLLFIFMKKKKDPISVLSWITIFFMLWIPLLYWNPGARQIGYRFALDFYPFLLLLVIAAVKPHLTLGAKWMIILGAIINNLLIQSVVIYQYIS